MLEELESSFAEFLNTDTQLNKDADADMQMLEHRQIALLVHHLIKEQAQKTNTFVIAGAEDLKVLLSSLTLSRDTDEAFILIRPYIHSEAIYLRNINGVIHSFWFDSQAWGSRYYPNRAILTALIQGIPEVVVFSSEVVLQSHSINNTCSTHAINFLQYAAKHGSSLFQALAKDATVLVTFPDGNSVNAIRQAEYLPFDIVKLAEDDQDINAYLTAHPEAHEQLANFKCDLATDVLARPSEILRQRYKDYFKIKVLPFYLDQQQQLDWLKINQVVSEMHGLHLPASKQLLPDQQNCFKLKLTEAQTGYNLDIRLASTNDFNYDNFFEYTSAVYPKDKNADNTTLLLDSKKLEDSGMSIVIKGHKDTDKNSYSYHAESLEQLQVSINNFRQNNHLSTLIFQRHMRQSLAFAHFLEEAQEAIELELISRNEIGGLYLNQIIDALRFYLREHKEVEVLGGYFSKVEQDKYLIIDILAAQQLKCNLALIPYAVTTDHCALIAVNYKTAKIYIFDPRDEADNLLSSPLLAQIKANFPLYEIIIYKGNYFKQEYNYECGVHVIQEALELVNAVIKVERVKLDIQAYLPRFLRAAKLYSLQLSTFEKQQQNEIQHKILLLDVVETLRYETGNFQKKGQANDQLKKLADALQYELWGNVDRKDTPTDNSGREQTQSTLIRSRAFTDFKADFTQNNIGDFGSFVLNQLTHFNFAAENASLRLAERLRQLMSERALESSIYNRALTLINDQVDNIDTLESLEEHWIELDSHLQVLKTVISADSGIEQSWSVIIGIYKRLLEQRKEYILARPLEKTNEIQAPTINLKENYFFKQKQKVLQARKDKIAARYPALAPEVLAYFSAEGYNMYAVFLALDIATDNLVNYSIAELQIIKNQFDEIEESDNGPDDGSDDEDSAANDQHSFIKFIFDKKYNRDDSDSLSEDVVKDLSAEIILILFKQGLLQANSPMALKLIAKLIAGNDVERLDKIKEYCSDTLDWNFITNDEELSKNFHINITTLFRGDNVNFIHYLFQSWGLSCQILIQLEIYPLCTAAKYNAEKLINYLLDTKGIDAQEVDDKDNSALEYAISVAAMNVVEILLKRNAKFELTSPLVKQGIKSALYQRKFELITFLDGCNYNFAAVRYDKDRTVLHEAVLNGYTDSINFFLSHADYAKRDANNKTALDYAASLNKIDICRIIIKNALNADSGFLQNSSVILGLQRGIIKGVKHSRLDFIQFVVEELKIIIPSFSVDATLADFAVALNRQDIYRYLLETGIDITKGSKFLKQACLEALKKNDYEAFCFISQFSSLNIITEEGNNLAINSLWYLKNQSNEGGRESENSQFKILKTILQSNFDVDYENEAGLNFLDILASFSDDSPGQLIFDYLINNYYSPLIASLNRTDVSIESSNVSHFYRNQYGHCLLYLGLKYASMQQLTDFMQILLQKNTPKVHDILIQLFVAACFTKSSSLEKAKLIFGYINESHKVFALQKALKHIIKQRYKDEPVHEVIEQWLLDELSEIDLNFYLKRTRCDKLAVTPLMAYVELGKNDIVHKVLTAKKIDVTLNFRYVDEDKKMLTFNILGLIFNGLPYDKNGYEYGGNHLSQIQNPMQTTCNNNFLIKLLEKGADLSQLIKLYDQRFSLDALETKHFSILHDYLSDKIKKDFDSIVLNNFLALAIIIVKIFKNRSAKNMGSKENYFNQPLLALGKQIADLLRHSVEDSPIFLYELLEKAIAHSLVASAYNQSARLFYRICLLVNNLPGFPPIFKNITILRWFLDYAELEYRDKAAVEKLLSQLGYSSNGMTQLTNHHAVFMPPSQANLPSTSDVEISNNADMPTGNRCSEQSKHLS